MYSIIERTVPDVRNDLHEKGLLDRNSTVLFQVGSCALVESAISSCRYLYTAVCLRSGRHERISIRKTQIHRSQYDYVAEKIMMLPFYEGSEAKGAHERGQALVARIFAEVLPQHGFAFRESQMKLSLTIYNAMAGKQIALCEAGTGSGKTLAYLVAAVVYGLFQTECSTVIVSTSTIALQKAITEDYLPQLSEILLEYRIIERPLTFVIRKGKSHYVCDLRLQGYHAAIANLGTDEQLMEQLAGLGQAPPNEIDLSLHPISRYVKDRICVSGRCVPHCPLHDSCRYQAHMTDCLKSKYDFQLTNHNYLLAHVQHIKAGGRGILPAYGAVIFDEAHKLLDAAQQIYGIEYRKSDMEELAESVSLGRFTSRQHRKVVAGWLEMLLERNTKLFELVSQSTAPLSETGQQRYPATIRPTAIACMKKIVEELQHLETLCGYYCDKQVRQQLPVLRFRCQRLAESLMQLAEPQHLIPWIEYCGEDVSLYAIPAEMDRALFNDLWSGPAPAVLTSGTLSVSGDYSLLKQTTGLNMLPASRILEASLQSPFDYEHAALLYIPRCMPFPDNHDHAYVKAIADEVMALIHAAHGHTLVLFTSYWLMERVFSLTKDTITEKYPAFILKRGRVDILSEFRNSGNGVLFASDAAGEGVDLPGDILSSLIIVKLPFTVPDPISEHERGKYDDLAEYQEKVVTPSMLIKLKQYVGRAIRTEADTAVISILDSRVGQGGKYRKAVLDALPPMKTTGSIYDVEEFFRNRKGAEYFAVKGV